MALDVQYIKDVTTQLATVRQELEAQHAARAGNVDPVRPDEDSLKALDSSLKRNTALINRLKKVSEETCVALLDDIRKVNQSKYVSEAVAAIVDAPLKPSDVQPAVSVCEALHQRYDSFGSELAAALGKALAAAGKGGADDVRRRRCLLRLYCDLLLRGVVADTLPLAAVVADLARTDWAADRAGSQAALSLLLAFVKPCRTACLGLPPAPSLPLPAELQSTADGSSSDAASPDLTAALAALRQEQAAVEAAAARQFQLPEGEQRRFSGAVKRAFEGACAALVAEHAALAEQERENARILNTRGDLPADAAREYADRRVAAEVLQRGVASLAEALGQPMPALTAPDDVTRMDAADSGAAAGAGAAGKAAADDAPQPVFEDQEARAFYESLPDLRALVPAVLLGEAKESKEGGSSDAKDPAASAAQPSAAAATDGDAVDGFTPGGGEGGAVGAASAGGAPSAGGGAATGASAAAAGVVGLSRERSRSAGGLAAEADGTVGSDAAGQASTSDGPGGGFFAQVDAVLARLPGCYSRDACDEIAVEFCYHNSKAARRRLVRALVDLPRGGLQLLPFYARVAATVSQVFPDVAKGVLSYLEDEFSSLLARKDVLGLTLEPRLRNARYIGELAKFRLAHFGSVFSMLKSLLDDFSGHNIEAACALVETAGRFLIRLPETKSRMEAMSESMVKLKNAKHLDARQAAAVDGAYAACRPPEGGARRRKARPPAHEYVRYLVFDCLGENSVAGVMKQLLRLPWAQHERYVLKCLLKVVRGRFSAVPLIASLAGGLSRYYPSLGIALVDCVLEDIRWGLEHPGAGLYQKRVGDVRLLGELYNYVLLDSGTLMATLYLILGHGRDSAASAVQLDPPGDCFRIRLVCTLLQTVGSFFHRGSARRRLDRFLVFFQAYTLAKAPLPLDIEFELQELFEKLRPTLKRFTTAEDANQAVSELLAREAAKRGGAARAWYEDDSSGSDEEPEAPAVPKEEVQEEGFSDSEAAAGEVDDEFEREYAALTQDFASKARIGTAPGGGAFALGALASGIALGGAANGGVGRSGDGANGGGEDDPDGGGASGEPERVAFRMLVKRGGKDDRSRELRVPADARLVVGALARQSAEEAERAEVKRITLAVTAAATEEELAAARAATRRGRGKATGGGAGGSSSGGAGSSAGGGGGQQQSGSGVSSGGQQNGSSGQQQPRQSTSSYYNRGGGRAGGRGRGLSTQMLDSLK